jgi:hypothetical protein
MALNLGIRTAIVLVAFATAASPAAPEATAPEATAPEATAPEATAPEATAPEATAGVTTGASTTPPAAVPNSGEPRAKLASVDDEEPAEFAYDPSRPIPSGYVLRQRRRKGLIISGSIVFGVGYGASLLGLDTSAHKKDFDNGWLVVPVVGPLIGLATQRDTCESAYGTSKCGKATSTQVVLGTLFVMQAVGATLFTSGMVLPRRWLERASGASVAVLPALVDKGGYGVVAFASF